MRFRVTCWVLIVAVLVALGGSSALAQVADAEGMMGADVVRARKAVMGAIGAQTGLLQKAVQADDLEAAKTAAATLAALAGAVPPLFALVHADVYPVPGSNYQFGGGDLERFTRQAAALQAAAQAAAQAKSAGEINVRAVFGTCSACHSTFRRSA